MAAGGPVRRAGAPVPAFLRPLVLGCLTGAVAVPAVLSAFLSPAVALPAGVALAACVFLVGFSGGLALMRGEDGGEACAAAAPAAAAADAFCPGLVLRLDPHGAVTALGGRDAADFSAYMHEAPGRPFIDQVHVSDRIGFATAIDALRNGAERASVTIRMERRAGEAGGAQFLYARAEMTAMPGADGRPEGIFCQLRDISEEEALREAAARAASEAESANDAKSRFLAAVSHELRTPLNAILGFSDILIGEYFGRLENDRQREYVRLIRQSGGHLLSVVNTMLDMSKIEAGRYELVMDNFSVAETMRACEAMLALQAKEKGVTLTSRVQRDIGEAVADQRAIQQVLINLVGNAIKFTEAGGVVSMDAVDEGGMLKISVGDTGIGIAPDKLEFVGQPFVQVQNDYTRRYEGTGLGLSLVKGLIALHGGSFAIESRPGEGTLVTVTVPMDGSGQPEQETGETDARTVEFPPRLTSRHRPAAAAAGGMTKENAVDDDAKAQIA